MTEEISGFVPIAKKQEEKKKDTLDEFPKWKEKESEENLGGLS